MESHITEIEVVDGHNVAHGRLHGFKYKKLYEVTVVFDTLKEAIDFQAAISKNEFTGNKKPVD